MKIADVKAIAWDLDGTLLDSFKLLERILLEVSKANGSLVFDSKSLSDSFQGGSLEDAIKNSLGLKSEEELSEVMISFLETQDSHYEGDINQHLFVDAMNLARAAAERGILQIVVTNRKNGNHGKASPSSIVASTVLAEYINEVRSADEVLYQKPDPRVITDWLEKHQIEPWNLLVIGDQHVDGQLAANLGARAILVRRKGDIPLFKTIVGPTKNIYLMDDLESVVFW